MRHRSLLAGAALAGTLAIVLTGCVPNSTAEGSTISVKASEKSCELSASTASSGAITFTISNSGSDVTELEILAEDKLRIVGEKENIGPGTSPKYVVQLDPGTYYTTCKPGMIGAGVGQTEFTVTGKAAKADASQKKLTDQAVTNYIGYVKAQTEELLPATSAFTAAYLAGDDDKARSLFASTRVFYERIEPTAEAFGDLDPEIDYREVDAVAEGLSWTGFHRIEKDLWPPAADALNSDGTSALLDWAPSTPEQRKEFADGLNADVKKLYDLVHAKDFTVSLSDISNGAIGLLDEVATGKISGEEDWWSHTDLTDFAANVQGAEVAFGNVKEIAAAKGGSAAKLMDRIQGQFDAMNSLLGRYGSIESGFTPYDEVTDAQRKELSDQVNALAEPLSQLTSTVLGL